MEKNSWPAPPPWELSSLFHMGNRRENVFSLHTILLLTVESQGGVPVKKPVIRWEKNDPVGGGLACRARSRPSSCTSATTAPETSATPHGCPAGCALASSDQNHFGTWGAGSQWDRRGVGLKTKGGRQTGGHLPRWRATVGHPPERDPGAQQRSGWGPPTAPGSAAGWARPPAGRIPSRWAAALVQGTGWTVEEPAAGAPGRQTTDGDCPQPYDDHKIVGTHGLSCRTGCDSCDVCDSV